MGMYMGSRTSQGRALARFLRREDGLSSIDWVVIAAGATGMGLMALSMGQDTLGTHSANVRGELEGGRFEAPWLDSLPVPQD
jgi:hypothetical protein